jgi:hypothetical protein
LKLLPTVRGKLAIQVFEDNVPVKIDFKKLK